MTNHNYRNYINVSTIINSALTNLDVLYGIEIKRGDA